MRSSSLRKPAPRAQGTRALDQLRALIAERYESLSPRLRQVARYALDHPVELAIESVTTVARDAGVQPSAVVRFAQAFGFGGFGDLQRVFRAEVAAGSTSYPERLRAVAVTEPATASGAFARFASAQALSIEHLGHGIESRRLDDAVQLLARARHIYVIGEGHDLGVAEYLRHALPLADRPTHVIAAGDSAADRLVRLISPRDVLIALSSPPHGESTARLGRLAAKQGVPLIVLSDGPVNPLAKSATIDFHIRNAEVGGMPAITATLCLASYLAAGLIEETQAPAAAE